MQNIQMGTYAMKQFYVYIHYKPNGIPFYVGKGSMKRTKDFWNGRNRHHRFVVNKYGKENIGIETIECIDEEHSFAIEIKLICLLRNLGFPLANVCDGGEGRGGRVLSEDHKRKISNANKNNQYAKGRKRTEAFKDNLRNKEQSLEHRQKNSIANKGRKKPIRTEAHKNNISLAMKGKPWSLARRESQQKRKVDI